MKPTSSWGPPRRSPRWSLGLLALIVVLACGASNEAERSVVEASSSAPPSAVEQEDAERPLASSRPYLVVLGTAQDGGDPQVGDPRLERWDRRSRRLPTALGLVGSSGERYLFEATPAFAEQLLALDRLSPRQDRPGLDGVFLTHAHIGHYVGLMYLGFEVMGAQGVPVYAMPEMASFLRENGPWSQLVSYDNVDLRELQAGRAVTLDEQIAVTPVEVPHRREFAETVGYRIAGPERTVFFLPDIDGWEQWDEWGVRVEDEIAGVDLALLDGSFWYHGEIPGRDMSGFPHPMIKESLERFAALPAQERAKIVWIHLNHTNPAAEPGSPERAEIEAAGMRVAEQGEILPL